jgi:DNA-binding NarL/FixJ family response regulator
MARAAELLQSNTSLAIGAFVPAGLLSWGLQAALSNCPGITFHELTFDAKFRDASELDALIIHSELADEDAWRRLNQSQPRAGILVLAGRDLRRVIDLFMAGARAFVSEESTIDELVAGVEAVTRGHSFFPKPLKEFLLDGWTTGQELSPGERQVLSLVAIGESDSSIARRLCSSIPAVKKKIQSILRKMGARNRTQAAVVAVLLGLTPYPLEALPGGGRSSAPSPRSKAKC